MTDIADLKRRMEGAFDNLNKDFSGLRTGRASPALLEPIMVPSYGGMVPLKSVGNINAPEARLLTVTVWDKTNVAAVDKAIRDAGLGLNPSPDGMTIRVPIPALTEDRRAELAKVAGKFAEEARVSVRNIRRDGNESIKAAKLPEDEAKRKTEEVQKLTDDLIKRIDTALSEKETEIKKV